MIDIKLRVSPADGSEYAVAITLPTWVDAEEHFDVGVPKLFSSGDVGFRHLSWIAWAQARRDDLTGLDYDRWLDGIAGVEMEGGDAGPLDETT